MKRLKNIKYTWDHKIAIYQLWKKYDTKVSLLRVIFHDVDKLFLKLFLNEEQVHNIHQKISAHHGKMSAFPEAYLDWASARITKPDKPLDAIQTAEKYYPHLLNKAKEHYKLVKFK